MPAAYFLTAATCSSLLVVDIYVREKPPKSMMRPLHIMYLVKYSDDLNFFGPVRPCLKTLSFQTEL